MSIGLPSDAAAGRNSASRAAHVAGQLGDLDPGGLAGVGAQDPGPAGVGDDRDPVAARHRLRGQQRGDVEQLVQRVGADHAGLLEQRVDGHVGGRQQRAGVRRGRAGAGGRAAALDRQDRLGAREPGGRCARTCAGCRTTRGRAARRSVSGSCSQYWRKSLPDRSALLPTETNDDSPTPRRLAASMIAIPRPPLCDMKPTRPGTAAGGAKVALSRTSGAVLSTPRQLGPTSRIPASRQTSSSSRWRAAPSAPVSANPAEITSSAAHAGGRALARDVDHLLGGHGHHRQLDRAGNVAHRAVGRAATGPRRPVSLTAYTAPLNSAASRLCRISPPIVPRRRDAPITATERGSRKLAHGGHRRRSARAPRTARPPPPTATSAARPRSHPGVERSSTGKPLSRKTSIIRWLCGSTSRDERRDPVLLGDLGEMGEQDRRDPAPLPRVGDQERDLGALVVDPHVGRVGDDRARVAGLGDQPEPIRVVDVDRPRGRPVEVRRAEEAKPDRLRRDGTRGTRASPARRRPGRGARARSSRRAGRRRPHAQMDISPWRESRSSLSWSRPSTVRVDGGDVERGEDAPRIAAGAIDYNQV